MPAHTIIPATPWGTLFTTLTLVNCSPTQRHACMLSVFCSVQLKPWFIGEEHTSLACQWPSKVSICPVKLVMTPNCSQVKTLVRTQMSFPETVSDSLCRSEFVVKIHSFISCPGGWSQTIPQVKKPDVEVLGWGGYTWSAIVRPFEHTAKLSNNDFGSSLW